MRIFLASTLNFVLFHCQLCKNNKILGKNYVVQVYLCQHNIPMQLQDWLYICRECNSLHGTSVCTLSLKVHKNENFFGFDFEFHCQLCQNIKILQKKIFDWAIIGGGTIFPRSPRTTRNEKNFWARSKKYFFVFLFMNPL